MSQSSKEEEKHNNISSSNKNNDTISVVTRRLSPMPTLPITSPTTIENCKNLALRESDIFICSYPKSGTTWTQHIVLSLCIMDRQQQQSSMDKSAKNNNNSNGDGGDGDGDNDNEAKQLHYDHVSQFAPFFEIDPHWDNSSSSSPSSSSSSSQGQLIESIQAEHTKLGRRVFNTHLRYDMLPYELESNCGKDQQTIGDDPNSVNNNSSSTPSTMKLPSSTTSGGAKFIYLIRRPLDVCVSFYHHLSNQCEGGYDGDFNNFFVDWVNGKIAFGSYIDHITSFLPSLTCQNLESRMDHPPISGDDIHRTVLLISYEELLSELETTVRKIARFIDVQLTDEQIQQLLPTFEFQNMKSNLDRFQPKSVTWKNNFQFLRKGVAGDSNSLITNDQRTIWNKAIEESKILSLVDTTVSDPENKRRLQSLFS